MWCGRVEWWIEPLLRTGSDGSDEIAKVYTPFIYLVPGPQHHAYTEALNMLLFTNNFAVMFHYSGMNFPTHYAHARGNRGPAMYCKRALLKGEGVNVVKVFCVCVTSVVVVP